MSHESGATIFGYEMRDPSGFDRIVLHKNGRTIDLEERTKMSRSRLAVPGLYFYEQRAVAFSNDIMPSARGELEIIDVNRRYLAAGDLRVALFNRGIAWLEVGAHRDLFDASEFVKVVEKRTGQKIACPEEVAWQTKFIDQAAFESLIDLNPKTEYQRYLCSLVDT
jgi:glucose-1-phosphate thymidylyltransferase